MINSGAVALDTLEEAYQGFVGVSPVPCLVGLPHPWRLVASFVFSGRIHLLAFSPPPSCGSASFLMLSALSQFPLVTSVDPWQQGVCAS